MIRRLMISAFALALAAPGLAQAAGDAAKGAELFKQRCAACHIKPPTSSVRIAPDLVGVVGRKAASTDFTYSAALKASGLTWTPATLDSFLTAPFTKVPGTRMVISVPATQDRADLIAFLASRRK
jgi:cytochrome c